MTRTRYLNLMDLIDEFNAQVNAVASISYGHDEESIHISMFYVDEYHSFTTDNCIPGWYNSTHGDTDLLKAEAFMRMLMQSAQFCEVMRRD